MSKIHALETNDSIAQVVLHTATPVGNNSVGVSWKDAGLNSGKLGTTALTEGTGAGQILTTEKAQVEAGGATSAQKMINLLRGVEHGWKHSKRKSKRRRK